MDVWVDVFRTQKTICLTRCVFLYSQSKVQMACCVKVTENFRDGAHPRLVEPTFGCTCCATRRSLIYPLWQPTSCSNTGCPSQGITQVFFFVLRRDIPRLCHETQHRMWFELANGVRWRLVAFGTIGATQCLIVVGSRCRRLLADRRIAST